MEQNVTIHSLDDIENIGNVLNLSRYSLQDASGEQNDPFGLNDVELLDKSVTDLLDDPYRMKLRRNSNYDGFDQSLGDSWIYPVNYPLRQYQFTITEAALFKNTLVVLPTGLGKTFIAAVVMYNIYRWYPTGKVIFMAPTRPLVSQQIEACYRIMGIPRSDTAEVTGKQQRQKRSALWSKKRVFYTTPQVVLADLESLEPTFPVQQVRLVVIDEAHKAKGRYAYTDVIRLIAKRNPYFRVLALSATPGRTLEDVAEVIKNLLISHVEVRWDNSIDVLPYVFRKDVRTIVIPLGQTIVRLRKELLQLVNPYLQRLLESKVFLRYPDTVTAGMLIMEQKRFRNNALQQRHPNHSAISADFSVCISMYHALDLLVKHGIRAFLNFFDDGAGANVKEKYFVANDRQIKTFLNRLREQYQHRQQQQQHGLDNSSDMTGNDDIDFGHPKYRILEQQLVTFFKEFPDSKAIVFCEFRDSVAMIKRLLSKNQPLIRPNCIVGQGAANGVRVPQHDQIDVMRHFRSGTYNTLIATCVAEEGIDVGEVDLIVCFDVAKNPVRFVQRIGRTGRQRVGRVLMLVTEGEEHDTLKHVLASKDKTNQQLARSKDILRILYRHSPPLVPAGLQPTCVKMFMNISDTPATVRHGGSDSSDSEPENTLKGSSGKRKSSRLLDDATEMRPFSKRTKTTKTKTRDVREFFQRQQNVTTDVLNTSECDIFAVDSSNQKSKDGLLDRTHGSTSIPIDQTIRHGRTDAEVAIAALLQPLIRHYKQLCRQKCLFNLKLLQAPKTTQFERKESSTNVPVMDDPLELPELVPRELGQVAEISLATDGSISNLFDSTLNLSETATTHRCLWEADTRRLRKESEIKLSVKKSSLSVLKKAQNHCTSPKNPCDSPLLLAFNRSAKKRKNSDAFVTPARTNAGSITSKPSDKQNVASVSQKMVLEYFRLQSLEEIFSEDSSEESGALGKASTAIDQRKPDENITPKGPSISRRLFDVFKNSAAVNVTAKHTRKEEEYASTRTNVETTLNPHLVRHEQIVNQHLTKHSNRVMKSNNNFSKTKNFDLGPAELVFEDDSKTEVKGDTIASSKSFSREVMKSHIASSKLADRSPYFVPSQPPNKEHESKSNNPTESEHTLSTSSRNNETNKTMQSPISSSKFAKLFTQSNEKICTDHMYLLPGRSPYFAASYVKLPPSPNENNMEQSNELSHTVHIQPNSGRNNETMNESVVKRKVRRAVNYRIDSSAESVKDDTVADKSQDHDSFTCLEDTRRHGGKARIDKEEEDDNIFQSVNELRSSHTSKHSNKRTKPGKGKLRKVKQIGRDFFQSQAAISDDSDDDDDAGNDSDVANSLENFVVISDDEESTVDMHAVYLQSVRSPLVRRGGFKILSSEHNKLQKINDSCLNETETFYTEIGTLEADVTNMNEEEQLSNSFIDDDSIIVSSGTDLSEREIAELRLKERRRRNRRIRRSDEQSSAGRNTRRLCILNLTSDSD